MRTNIDGKLEELERIEGKNDGGERWHAAMDGRTVLSHVFTEGNAPLNIRYPFLHLRD